MKITLVSLNYSPELTGIGKYNGEMAPWFVAAGDNVDVVCAPPYYPEWKVHAGYSGLSYRTSVENGVRVTRCPLYVPAQPSTIKRLSHLASFAFTSGLALFAKVFKRPDVVFVVEPTLFTVPVTLLFCKLVGAKSVLHIQDYEVDAMFGLGMAGKAGFLASAAYKVERWLMRRFDAVSTISFSMMTKAEQKGVDPQRLVFFPNWSDTSFVHPSVDGSDLRKLWGVTESQKIVLYAGNIGAKQGLELVLDAAERYLSQPDIRFFLVGSGAYATELQSMATQRGLSNVEFKPLQAWEDVPAMLAMADVHLVVQRKGAADAVLPSKLTNILSAGGNAVITAEADTELGRLVNEYPGIYSCVEPENVASFCQGLETELAKSGVNSVAREYAEKNLNKEAILGRFREDLLSLIG
ncbi:glycosyltransferase WbuB [Thalassolituus oleivorans]|uniref:Putative glycosyl transferase n=1 Tax=Thalassolituus oleivorans MIL-1 TaxID=1298593 RepID=M5DSS5_9GAMM|nr:glycosyltransferase WbuB [Thalassolituus oleivorans]CCU72966.1 putative glycosyl transferase [Thalassolituus oleivorans MIL-1]